MRIAYIISAYKHPQQLVRLVRRLHTSTSSFFVHVDKRAGHEMHFQIVDALSDLPNICFLRRHSCYWGGFGHVEATIKGINALMERRLSFDYVILLTGQDYPIKPNSYIEDLLQESNGKAYMEFFKLPYDGWERGGMDRIEYWHFRPFAEFWRSLASRGYDSPKSGSRQSFLFAVPGIRRKFPKGFRPFGGSSYWCLPRGCIEYLFEFIGHNHSFVNYFKHVDVPDEIFFQTILLNSPHGGNIVNCNLRYVDWKDPDSGSPALLGSDDLERLRSSSGLFARKFDMTLDNDILDSIDRVLLAVK